MITDHIDSNDPLLLTLVAAVHEIKNDGAVLFAKIDELESNFTHNDEQHRLLMQLKTQARKMNHSLLGVLSRYREHQHAFQLSIAEHFFDDLFAELKARHVVTCEAYDLELVTCCDVDEQAFCDATLIHHIMDTCVFNAAKAGAKRIEIAALSMDRDDAHYQCIKICDDGPGFPESILQPSQPTGSTEMDLQQQTTGLGLDLARSLLQMHSNHHGQAGFLELSNLDDSGACVALFFP